MPLLTRRRRLFVSPEQKPGVTYSSGTTPGPLLSSPLLLSGMRAINPLISVDFGSSEVTKASQDIGEEPPLPGLNTGTITFELEMAGNSAGSATTPPGWDPLLKACGWERLALQAVTITAFTTGTRMLQGLTLTPTGSTVPVRVAQTLQDGWGTTLLIGHLGTILPLSGVTALTVTNPGGVDNGNTVSVSAVAAASGSVYLPASAPTYVAACGAPSAGTIARGTMLEGTSGAVIRLTRDVTGAGFVFAEPIYGFSEAGETFTVVGGVVTLATTGGFTHSQAHTVSIGVFEDGRLKVLRGCRGNCTPRLTAGGTPVMAFSFSGILETPIDAAPPALGADILAQAPRFVGANIWAGAPSGVNGFRPVVNELQFGLTSGPSLREDAAATQGATEYLSTARQFRLTADPEATPEAVFGQMAKTIGKTGFPLRVAWGTPGTGNAFEFHADRAVIRTSNAGDRGGKMTDAWDVGLYRTAGDDELSLVVR